jgi:hypothetical protein
MAFMIPIYKYIKFTYTKKVTEFQIYLLSHDKQRLFYVIK